MFDIILTFTNLGEWLLQNSEDMRNIAQTFQAIVTFVGIIAAGVWFYQRRQQFSRANLTHEIIDKELDKNTLLVHVTVTIENISNVPIELGYCKMRLQWVAPIIDDVKKAIQKAENNKEEKIKFPTIGDSKEWNFKDNNREDHDRVVEPGEKHDIECDFILTRDKLAQKVTTIMIYCYIENVKYRNRQLGWHFVDIYDLSKLEGKNS